MGDREDVWREGAIAALVAGFAGYVIGSYFGKDQAWTLAKTRAAG
jgi:hypothetical protein